MKPCLRTLSRALGGALLAAVVAASVATPKAGAVCLILDPVLSLGCEASPTPASGPAQNPTARAAAVEPSPALSSTVPSYDPRRLTVTFARGTSRRTIERVFRQAGVTSELAVPQLRAYLVDVDPKHRAAALHALRQAQSVEDAGREIRAQALDTNPNDTDWPQQAGIRVAGFPKAWEVTRGSSRVIVAVVDTGVDPAQPDLRGALVPGYDFVNDRTTPIDDHGHGTAVAGIIGARADNHEGVAGVCPLCSVMPVKVLDAQGTGPETTIAAGIVWAVDHGAQVINLSLGSPATTPELSDAVTYATRKGAVVVAAAGNSGSSLPFYPAAAPEAISVAATTTDDRAYSWSNFGSWVSLAAPGCNFAPLLGGGYGNFCGTSAATPVVSGLAALAVSASPTSDALAIEQALQRSAVPLPGVVRYGRIDAPRALSLLRPAQPLQSVLRGVVGPRRRTRIHSLLIGAGRLAATLTFAKGRRLSLSLTSPGSGEPIASVSGSSPLALERTLPAGTVEFVVGARGPRTPYVLSVSYPSGTARRLSAAALPDPHGPGKGRHRRIVLSRIPRLKGSGSHSPNPQLGAPRPIGPPRGGILEVAMKAEPVLAAEILRRINAVRADHGLSQLRLSAPLSAAAAAHARVLVGTGQFTHSWGNGNPFGDWILRYYPARAFREWSVGENLVWQSPTLTAESAVQAWLDSPTHRHVLLTPGWRELGIGVVSSQSAPGVFAGNNVSLAAADFGARIR